MPIKRVITTGKVPVNLYIDEIPGAYKDIDMVMENQSDLVEIVHKLKQLVCVKG